MIAWFCYNCNPSTLTKVCGLWHFSLGFGCCFLLSAHIPGSHPQCYCWPILPQDLCWRCPWMQISSFTNPRDVILNTFSLEYFSQFLSHTITHFSPRMLFIPLTSIPLCLFSLQFHLDDPPAAMLHRLNRIMQRGAELPPNIFFYNYTYRTGFCHVGSRFFFFFPFCKVAASSFLPIGREVNLGSCLEPGARGHLLPAGNTEHLPPLPTDFELFLAQTPSIRKHHLRQ